MGVGIDAFPKDMTVPEVAIDVVRELGREGKEGKAGSDAYPPQENQRRRRPATDADPRRRVAEEGGSGQQQARQWQSHPVQPPEGGESGHFEEAEQENEYDGRGCRFARTRRRPVVTGDVRCRWKKRGGSRDGATTGFPRERQSVGRRFCFRLREKVKVWTSDPAIATAPSSGEPRGGKAMEGHYVYCTLHTVYCTLHTVMRALYCVGPTTRDHTE